MPIVETACLSQDLQPGDRLLSAALGGEWDEEITDVRVGLDCVAVAFRGGAVRLGLHEVCGVRRYAMSAAADLRAQVDG